jgi:ABC-type antimicrobial peptide transport system permease subunit
MQREWAAAALRSVDAGVPVFRVQSLESYLAERMAAPRFHTGALVFLSGMSALIALLGVYGAVSYSVTRKLPEYGVRMALGATPGRLRTLLAVRVLAPAGLAGVAGLIAAGMAGRFLQSLMYGVKTELWMEGGAAALALLSGAAMAALLAARSLGRLNPMTLLRAE